jgi:hypothetical protein
MTFESAGEVPMIDGIARAPVPILMSMYLRAYRVLGIPTTFGMLEAGLVVAVVAVWCVTGVLGVVVGVVWAVAAVVMAARRARAESLRVIVISV